MISLDEKLNIIEQILTDSNKEIYADFKQGVRDSTGFMAFFPHLFVKIAKKLSSMPINRCSLDLGCGNGGWALFAAALGIPSYGIDISPYLVNKANENHAKAVDKGAINPDVPCKFAMGNYFPRDYRSGYAKFALKQGGGKLLQTMPCGFTRDPYKELGINIGDAGFIYAFPWIESMEFLCDFLEKETKRDTLFVLPHYSDFKEVKETKLVLRPVNGVQDSFSASEIWERTAHQNI